jgi:6-phosphofructokinase 1
MKKIGILTSGGDAPGMNANIRAVVRYGLSKGLEVIGIEDGYAGLIEGKFKKMHRASTANIIALGGTILYTSRCKAFHTVGGRAAAADRLREHNIDGLIVCGGDGTFHGAHALYEEHGIPVIGVPGTIDNDLYGTDWTIGYDTAINTAAEAIDKIRDTAYSHGRVFIIEVMGRNAGFIAMDVGIAAGAEYIAIPETESNIDILYKKILEQGRNKRTIVIVGEGDEIGGAMAFSKILKERFDVDSHVTILGHIQRGGSPTVRDRVLATRLGVAAVDAMLEGKTDIMVGQINKKLSFIPLEDTWTKKKQLVNYQIALSEAV